MKKIIALILIFIMTLSITVTAFAVTDTDSALDYNSENSYQIVVNVDEKKTFTSEDFPEVSCSNVVVASLKKTEEGYEYTLIVIYEEAVDVDVEKEKIVKNTLVTSVEDNEYVTEYSEMILSESKVYLKVGETRDITVKAIKLVPNAVMYTGIMITLDTTVYDMKNVDEGQFEACGIQEFMTLEEAEDNNLLEASEDISDKGDEYWFGKLKNVWDKKETYVEIIDAITKLEGVETVYLYGVGTSGGEPPNETWEIEDENIANVTVSGGELALESLKDSYVNQTGTIVGLEPGTTTLKVRRGEFSAQANASCQIVVYKPGDADSDGDADANDSLSILKTVASLE